MFPFFLMDNQSTVAREAMRNNRVSTSTNDETLEQLEQRYDALQAKLKEENAEHDALRTLYNDHVRVESSSVRGKALIKRFSLMVLNEMDYVGDRKIKVIDAIRQTRDTIVSKTEG